MYDSLDPFEKDQDSYMLGSRRKRSINPRYDGILSCYVSSRGLTSRNSRRLDSIYWNYPCADFVLKELFPLLIDLTDEEKIFVSYEEQDKYHLRGLTPPELPARFLEVLECKEGLSDSVDYKLRNEFNYSKGLRDPRFIEDFWRIFNSAACFMPLAKYEMLGISENEEDLVEIDPDSSSEAGRSSYDPIPVYSDLSDLVTKTIFGTKPQRDEDNVENTIYKITKGILEGLDSDEFDIFFGSIRRYALDYIKEANQRYRIHRQLYRRLLIFSVPRECIPLGMKCFPRANRATYKGKDYELDKLGARLVELLDPLIDFSEFKVKES